MLLEALEQAFHAPECLFMVTRVIGFRQVLNIGLGLAISSKVDSASEAVSLQDPGKTGSEVGSTFCRVLASDLGYRENKDHACGEDFC